MIKPSMDKRVAGIQKTISNALGVFKKAYSDLESANNDLQTVVGKCNEVIGNYTLVRDDASARIADNKKVMANIKTLLGA